MLTELELAFAENLLLLGATTGPRLIYAMRLRALDARPLWDLVADHGLAAVPPIREAHAIADAALQAMGPQAFSFSEGAMVGPWELAGRRGEGLSGEVWQATRPGGDVATLRLIPPGSGRDPARVERFIERSNVGLDPPHPSILKVDEGDEDFGWLYAATLGLDCSPLAGMIGQGPLDEATALALAQSVAGSLSVVHGLGVVHGGLSPLGIALRESRVYLTDFGVSAALLDGPAEGSRPGGRLGLLLYASPNLLVGDGERGLDSRDDLYAFGAVIYHAVCAGQPGAMRAPPQLPWVVDPPVSDGFKAVLARLLAPEEARYPNIQSVQNDLAAVAAGQPPGTSPPMAGGMVRGRRHPGAGPQELFRAELIRPMAAPEPLEASTYEEASGEYYQPEPAVEPEPAAPPPPVAEEEEQLGEDEEWVYEDEEEEQKPRKNYRAPSQRFSAVERFEKPQPTAVQKGGGWLAFTLTLVLVLGGLGAAHALTLPQGADRGRWLVSQALVVSTRDRPDFGAALASAREALDLLKEPADRRDALREWEAVQERALAARAALIPLGSQTGRDDLIKQRDALTDLLVRSLGTRAAALINFDLARCGDTIDLPTWQSIGEALLRQGCPAEAVVAFDKGSKKDRLELARLAEQRMVFVPGGPFLVPDDKGALSVEEREPAYLWRTEVTRAEYARFYEARKAGTAAVDPRVPEDHDHTPKGWDPKKPGEGALPATGVDYWDAVACAKYAGLELADQEVLRAAACGRLALPYPWGGAKPDLAFLNAGAKLQGPTPAGSFPGGESRHGAQDLLGNVAEWCAVKQGVTAPQFGGHFGTKLEEVAPKASEPVAFEERSPQVGFRLMKRLPAE
ncbi:MAG: SUMF1/EgtB/PvdO family nonheme iron enzyme [Planctomycetota bacterium]